MNAAADSTPGPQAADIAELAAAIADVAAPVTLWRAVERIAMARMKVSVFSVSTCFLETLELERVYSSRLDAYPTGARKSKGQTSWAQQVLRNRQVFVGEGPLEMAAAFDDQERMASLGIRSIINVPIVVGDRCRGVLNFGRSVERVAPAEVALARFLGLASCVGFLIDSPRSAGAVDAGG